MISLMLQNREDPLDTKLLKWDERNVMETMNAIQMLGTADKGYKIVECEGEGKLADWFKKMILKREKGTFTRMDLMGLLKVMGI